ncbi:hypothetical protein ACFVVL_00065 [Kitasatospora sp. NPDC058115]|uniref:hypothetical protein n=1 Tax=Kitasatospora sp. NPDC058115 TaxID=3346347 RepID=UPI0036DCA773
MSVRERDLRRSCKRLLRKLEIQPPLRVDELCRRLGEYRGKPIRLIPWPLPVPGPFGVWMSRDDDDCIFYQQETTRVHQDHIILHEIGHLLADHQDDGTGAGAAAAAFPDLGPEYPWEHRRRGFLRTCYDEDNEREAELVATILQEWAVVTGDLAPRGPQATAPGVLRSALGSRWGRT